MKNLILWIITFVTFFAYTFPPLELSKNRAAKIARNVMFFAMGLLLGLGTGYALKAIIRGW